MVTIEQIKEYTKCPQFGDADYGKWGALTLEQRRAYRYLIDIIDSLDQEIKRLNNESIKDEYPKVFVKIIKDHILSLQKKEEELAKKMMQLNYKENALSRKKFEIEEPLIIVKVDLFPFLVFVTLKKNH